MNLLDELNPMQKNAAGHINGPLLILAGAGSGKTRVLTYRIAHLIAQGIDPFNILAITFTNKAAKEMRERVNKLTPRGEEVWVSTFHSLCVKILRREISALGFANSFAIYDADDSERLMKAVIRDLNFDEKLFPPKSMLNTIGRCKDDLVSHLDFEKSAKDYRSDKISQIYTAYQKRLATNNALDFDDIIFKTVELFSRFPNILEKYHHRFKYIMVDEYQDTNNAQYELIWQISSKSGNLCVVGDDDQSIYGWRGANIRNILNFETDFKGTNVIKLEQNYRSTSNILNAANAVIGNNENRKSKSLWSDKGDGEKIKVLRADNDIDEGEFICDIIKKAKSEGKSYSDFAILYRTNAISRILEDRLVKANIPYRLFGGVRFYERKEIKDILAYLRSVHNPWDEISIRRIINIPKRGIGDATIEKVAAFAREEDISFYSALERLSEIPGLGNKAKSIKAFVDYINELKVFNNEEQPVSKLLEKIIDETGYVKELEQEGTDEARGRRENINELISKAAEYEKNSQGPSLDEFLEEVSLVASIDNYDEDEETVVLMTLHSSKGLEFPTVFIVATEEGIFPGNNAVYDSSRKELEEERRLFYVGITRAKKELFISSAKSRMQRGHIVNNPASRFLEEIPKNLIKNEFKQAESVKPVQQKGVSKFSEANKSTQNINISFGGKNYFNNIPAPKNVTLSYEVGDKVKQAKYGIGIVKEIKPAGADYEITIQFEENSVKKFMATFANIKKLQE